MNASELTALLLELRSPRTDWLRVTGHSPYLFEVMNDLERSTLYKWFKESEEDWPYGNGASGFTAMCTVSGFLLGSGIKNLVQCGHYIGFSTIILGSVFRYMGRKRAIYSMDIHEKAHAYTLRWVKEAGLEDVVQCVLMSSDEESNVQAAREYFGGDVESVFIDSSHAYSHTICELELWFRALRPTGFVFLHDVSDLAKEYDSTNLGGVRSALLDFIDRTFCRSIQINAVMRTDSIYTDPCGLGVLQKP